VSVLTARLWALALSVTLWLLIGLGIAAVLSACGGTEPEPEFENRAALEAFVAAHLGVGSVSCTKTTDVTARCVATGGVYLIACQTEDGDNCVIRKEDS
jgi:hypothetical protein